ncbi:MAG: hypothetical protein EOP04_01005 [Proteobacteria bacterium]|nr:MAG: hypothetical protein EOP04_01005 [Pseudomonadota bacterium]
MSFSSVIFLSALVLSVTSCKHLSNTIQITQLECGMDFKSSEDYFKVISPTGQTLGSYEFEAFKFENNILTQLPISTRACVPKSSLYSIIVRSKFDDTAALIDPSTQVLKNSVQLTKVNDLAASIACDTNVKVRVQPKELVNKIFSYNLKSTPIGATRVIISYENKELKQENFTLKDGIFSDRTFEFLSEGATHRVTISIENLMKRDSILKKDCSISVDERAPEVELQVNSKIPSNVFDWHGTKKIAVLEDNDAISLESSDGDISYMEYCSVKLNDDFLTIDSPISELWTQTTNLLNCSKFEQATVGQRILPNSRGFWSIIFRARDLAGNVSLIKNQPVFLRSGGKSELIKTKAKISIRNSISENRFEEAVSSILDLERQRLELPTHFERLQVKKFLMESMLTILFFPNLSLNLQSNDNQRFGEIYRFAPLSGDLVAYLPGEKVVFWDSKSGLVKRSFPISADKDLQGMDISHDEQRMLLNYRSRFEVWKKVGNTYEFEKSKESYSDFFKTYFANDSKSVITTSASSISVYDADSLEWSEAPTDAGDFYGRVKLAVPSRSTNLYYVNRSFQIVKFNILTKEKTVITDFSSTSKIRSIAVSPDENILMFASDDGTLTQVRLDNKNITKFVSIDNSSAIEWISFAPDSKSFATVALSASIRVRRSSDGEVLNTIKDYKSPAYELWFHPSGETIAASTLRGALKLWYLKDLVTSSDIPIDRVDGPKWESDEQFSLVNTVDEGKWLTLIPTEFGEPKYVDAASAYSNNVIGGGSLIPFTFEWCLAVSRESSFQLYKCEENFPIFKSKYVISNDRSIMISYQNQKLSFIRTSDFKVLAEKEYEYLTKFEISKDAGIIIVSASDKLSAFKTSDGAQIWSIDQNSNSTFWLAASQSFLIASDGSYEARFIDTQTGKEIGQISWKSEIYGGGILQKVLTNEADDLMLTSSAGSLMLWDNSEKVQMGTINSNSQCTQLIMNSSGSRVACIYSTDNGNKNRIKFWDLDFDRSLRKVCALSQKTNNNPVCKTN